MSERLRALVVEDDRSWQGILTELLTDLGLTVDLADHVDAAVAHLRAARHRLAVVDLSLGGDDHTNQDGVLVLDAVRLQDPGCVTVLLTGFATVELAVSALTEHGALTCLRKAAFRRSEFRELVNRALSAPRPVIASVQSASMDLHPVAPSPDASASPQSGSAGDLVLVVEDDAGWRSILSELLIESGYRVRSCGGFGEALGYLRREKYAVAVIDLSLSQVAETGADPEGYRLLKSTRSAGIPTVVVTGAAKPEAIQRAYLEYAVFACLEKRAFDRAAFRAAVNEARAVSRTVGDLDVLTDREREVLELLARGLTNKAIGDRLVITPNTVKRHLKSIFEKLEVHTRAAAVARAVSAGIPGNAAAFDDRRGDESTFDREWRE